MCVRAVRFWPRGGKIERRLCVQSVVQGLRKKKIQTGGGLGNPRNQNQRGWRRRPPSFFFS